MRGIYYDPFNPEQHLLKPRPQISGVSQRMYDAGIPVAQQTDMGLGLLSGEVYLDPVKSTAVMKHYPNKKLVRTNGLYN